MIAHELGHLLLPLNAHSPTGVMRAEWNEDDLNQTGRGALTFNLSQAKELRKSLNSQ